MSLELQERLERRRKEIYSAVRREPPDLYEQAVQIGHLALSTFIPNDDKRAATVESAVMSLIHEMLAEEAR